MNLRTTFAISSVVLGLTVAAQNPPPFDNPGVTANPAQGEVGTLQRFSLTYENEQGVFPNPYQYSITVTKYGETDVLMGATAMTDAKQYNIFTSLSTARCASRAPTLSLFRPASPRTGTTPI